MRPPECDICGKRFGPDEGDLIYFARDEAAENWHQRAEAEPGFVGHPPEAEWFCNKHLAIAKKYAHLPRKAAYVEIRKELG